MSEWKQDAARRRDARATKTDGEPKPRSKKNTRKWCKGVTGREHVLVIQKDPRWNWACENGRTWWPCAHQEVCETCGKVLRWNIPVEECPILGQRTDDA